MKKSSLTKIGISAMTIFSIGLSVTSQSCFAETNNQTVHIYSINDFHGAACGYGDPDINVSPNNPGVLRLANVLNDKIKASPNSMIVSAGDNNSGDVFSSSQQGRTIFPVLQGLNVRYSAVGNHEFDWEKTISTNGYIANNYLADKKYDLLARTNDTKDNYFIAANILTNINAKGEDNGFYNKTWAYDDNADYELWKQNKVKWADPYKIVDLGELKVCLIGLTTILTRTDGNKIATNDYAFIDYNASVEYAKKLCQEEKVSEFDKIDAFILLTHITSDMDGQKVVGESQELAQNLTTKIDAIISGHSHKVVSGYVKNNKFGNDIWIGQAGSSGRNYLDLELNYSVNEKPGKKLHSVKITTYKVNVNSTTQIEAQQELQNIENKVSDSSNKLLSNAINAFNEQKNIVLRELKKPLFKSVNSNDNFNLSYPALINCDIGHEYYCSQQIVDNAGLWLTKSIVDGCNIVNLQSPNDDILNKTEVSTSFLNIDSIRAQLLNVNEITKWDLYQFLTYDNYVVKGWLSISQLWNIMDYALSGGWSNNDKADDNSIFIYGQDNPQYDWIEKIETNCFSAKKEITLPEIKISDAKSTKLNYLAGPLQFYGCKIAVKEAPNDDQMINVHHARKYIVDYTEEKNKDGQVIKLPVMWLYDPADKDCDINDSTTWKRVTVTGSRYSENVNEWNYLEDLVPVVVDSFSYESGNYQNTMIKQYMKYNAHLSERYKVYTYPLGDFYTRDFVIRSCEYWNNHKTDASFDFNKFACKNNEAKMVVFANN